MPVPTTITSHTTRPAPRPPPTPPPGGGAGGRPFHGDFTWGCYLHQCRLQLVDTSKVDMMATKQKFNLHQLLQKSSNGSSPHKFRHAQRGAIIYGYRRTKSFPGGIPTHQSGIMMSPSASTTAICRMPLRRVHTQALTESTQLPLGSTAPDFKVSNNIGILSYVYCLAEKLTRIVDTFALLPVLEQQQAKIRSKLIVAN